MRGTENFWKSPFNEEIVCKLDLFKTAADDLRFHTRWYRKNDDPDICGHAELPLNFKQSDS